MPINTKIYTIGPQNRTVINKNSTIYIKKMEWTNVQYNTVTPYSWFGKQFNSRANRQRAKKIVNIKNLKQNY